MCVVYAYIIYIYIYIIANRGDSKEGIRHTKRVTGRAQNPRPKRRDQQANKIEVELRSKNQRARGPGL